MTTPWCGEAATVCSVLPRIRSTPFSSTADYERMVELLHRGREGLRFIRRYRTTPALIQFEQEVNQYVIEQAGT